MHVLQKSVSKLVDSKLRTTYMITKKPTRNILMIIVFVISFGCSDYIDFENNPRGNFDALWTILDENYCFFEYKNVDWDSVYNEYKPRVKNDMDSDALFDLMVEMLSTLKDGHVNLYASHDIGRYWNWMEDFPVNYNATIVSENYLGKDYSIVAGINYKMLEDSVGYIRYSSFANNVTNTGLTEIIKRFSACPGIIIDIRSNGGGSLANVDKIASHFFWKKTLVGYISHKTGKGHSDFSELYPKYIESFGGIGYTKKVVVLTNRGCYSAANDFVNVMKNAPFATIIGDKTGGGSGLPFSSELPNGWSVRFSASPTYNVNKEHIEFGIEPDILVEMTEEDMKEGKDTIIEAARLFIKNNR